MVTTATQASLKANFLLTVKVLSGRSSRAKYVLRYPVTIKIMNLCEYDATFSFKSDICDYLTKYTNAAPIIIIIFIQICTKYLLIE